MKKGRGSRHFLSLKIKLSPPFLSLPFCLPGLPHSRSSRVGPVVTAAAASPSPSVAAAEPGAPAREVGPLVWAGGGSSRQPGRATGRHSAMLAGTRLLPLREPACGPASARPPPALAAGRRSPGRARGFFSARLSGARALAGAARSATADSSTLGSAVALLPLLKRATPGGRLRPGQAPGLQASLAASVPARARVRPTEAGTRWPRLRERLAGL